MLLQLLNLALTKKSKQANELEEMCGFPLTSLDSYVEKLVRSHIHTYWRLVPIWSRLSFPVALMQLSASIVVER